MHRSVHTVFAVVLALTALAPPSRAAEYCVTCTTPDATYRCEVAGGGSGWLRCITELARDGGHDSCSVDRNAASPCPGLHKVLSTPDGMSPEPPLPVQAAIPEPPTPPPGPPQAGPPSTEAPPEAPAKRVPQTMQELTGDAFEASKDGLKKAGESVSDTAKKAGEGLSNAGSAVGNAAKKTWDCVSSLFQSC